MFFQESGARDSQGGEARLHIIDNSLDDTGYIDDDEDGSVTAGEEENLRRTQDTAENDNDDVRGEDSMTDGQRLPETTGVPIDPVLGGGDPDATQIGDPMGGAQDTIGHKVSKTQHNLESMYDPNMRDSPKNLYNFFVNTVVKIPTVDDIAAARDAKGLSVEMDDIYVMWYSEVLCVMRQYLQECFETNIELSALGRRINNFQRTVWRTMPDWRQDLIQKCLEYEAEFALTQADQAPRGAPSAATTTSVDASGASASNPGAAGARSETAQPTKTLEQRRLEAAARRRQALLAKQHVRSPSVGCCQPDNHDSTGPAENGATDGTFNGRDIVVPCAYRPDNSPITQHLGVSAGVSAAADSCEILSPPGLSLEQRGNLRLPNDSA